MWTSKCTDLPLGYYFRSMISRMLRIFFQWFRYLLPDLQPLPSRIWHFRFASSSHRACSDDPPTCCWCTCCAKCCHRAWSYRLWNCRNRWWHRWQMGRCHRRYFNQRHYLQSWGFCVFVLCCSAKENRRVKGHCCSCRSRQCQVNEASCWHSCLSCSYADQAIGSMYVLLLFQKCYSKNQISDVI